MDETETTLRGGGEMGALMRGVNWAKTPLGPVSSWPQSLKTAVSILLDSRFPMYVAWGPQYVQLYNDGYRPILGASKHPEAMGNLASKTFAESWHIIRPMFDDVMRGVATGAEDWMLPLARNGYLEECFFTFSYSPIRDESGGPGGVNVIVSETTARKLGERRLRTLHELAEQTTHATTLLDACVSAASVLEQHKEDVSFSLFYLLSEDGETLRLAARSGLPAPSLAAVEELPFDAGATSWPAGDVIRSGHSQTVTELDRRFGPLPGGTWPESTHTAMVLPIARPGQDRPYGVLVAGCSPRRALDRDYREFFVLVAGHVATAVNNARALEDERRRRNELAEIDRLKTAFFSNVSHEFRTPLTLLLGPAEDALAQKLAPEEKERWEVVQRNALRLSKMVNSLLDFARMEAGRIEAAYEPLDLSAFTGELASMFRSAIERGGLRLRLALQPGAEPAWVDREMWEKIVLNLLSNALKFTFEGEISVSLEMKATHFELRVADTGIGIAGAELGHVFDRFHRVKGARARTQEGTGIGLALVRDLTQLHGGQVSITSTEGKGSCVTVQIPRGKDHLAAEKAGTRRAPPTKQGAAPFVEEALRWFPASTANATPTAGTSKGTERILVADDNADMREYLTRLLGERWEVEAVRDGTAALEAARRSLPDLILSDVMMPGLDGFALVDALRTDPATRALPIILLSARAGDEAIAAGLKAGANDYLVKPFSARELLVRVASQLASSKLARSGQTIAEAERGRLCAHFMQAPFPVAVLRGRRHVIELANAPVLKVWGKTEAILGLPLIEGLPELKDQPFIGLLDGVLDSGEAYIGRDMPALLTYGSKLEEVFFNFVYAPLRDENAAVEGILISAFDVTAQVHARLAMERSVATAREADERKDKFLAMLAHELRNPLAALSGALQLRDVEEGPGSEKVQRLREISNRQVQNLMRMVDDLLDISRITQGRVELRTDLFDLHAVLRSAVDSAAPAMKARQHAATLELGEPPLMVNGDATRLEQVISNLLHNAIKFTEAGGKIVIRAERTQENGVPWVEIRVTDSGRGIPKDMLDRVFDLFVQVDKSLDRAEGGLGIGLNLVKALVQQHGGRVRVTSAGSGKGSEFVVALPLAGDASRAAVKEAAAVPSFIRRRVLLIEDNVDVRETLQECFEELGHDVSTAEAGLQGIDQVRELKPDVVFIDIGLPGIDGYEVARRLRASADTAAPYLIALSGYGGSEARARTVAAGFDLHLVKPISLEVMIDVLARLPSRASAES